MIEKNKLKILILCVILLVIITAVSVLVSRSGGTGSVGSSCKINLDDPSSWPQSNPPILLDQNGNFILPIGDSDSREFILQNAEIFYLGCSGTEFEMDGSSSVKTGVCGDNGELLVEDSQQGDSLAAFQCKHQPYDEANKIGSCGPDGKADLIRIDFEVIPTKEDEAVTITVCQDREKAASLWARHSIFDEVKAQDHGGSRPSFSKGSFYDFDVDFYYKMATQRETLIDLLGSEELADRYIGDQSSQLFLSRGHLAPNADFIFESWKDSSFWFVNVAPQWQSFNGRNWATFEDNCRDFAVARQLDLTVYTGTSGVMELRDVNDKLVPIFLYNRDQLPVPRYYWKVLHDPVGGAGVAVVGINNPHLDSVTDTDLLCSPLSSHPLLDMSNPHDIKAGYMFACRVEDLAQAVPEVPELPSMSLLE